MRTGVQTLKEIQEEEERARKSEARQHSQQQQPQPEHSPGSFSLRYCTSPLACCCMSSQHAGSFMSRLGPAVLSMQHIAITRCSFIVMRGPLSLSVSAASEDYQVILAVDSIAQYQMLHCLQHVCVLHLSLACLASTFNWQLSLIAFSHDSAFH